jgi:hypothetical protein
MFDFGFHQRLTATGARVLYICAMVGSGIWAALTLWAATLASNGLGALILLAMTPVVFIVPVGFARAALEYFLERSAETPTGAV